jgi:cytoplasmic iron level regulating protein YaaA (DUF328/UPF0246 family)
VSTSPDFVVCVPPSEGKASGGAGAPWQDTPQRYAALTDARRRLVDLVDPALATAPTMPAIERYTGVLYQYLDFASLPAAARRRATSRLVIFSGLWGVLAPTDGVPEYRCKIQTKLPDVGPLAAWWRPQLAPVLADRTRRRVVWDLLPTAHRAMWPDGSGTPSARYRVVFLEPDADGRLRAVSHWNKALKGALVRHLLTQQTTEPDELADFAHPSGYRYDRRRSEFDADGGTVVFVAT